MLHLGGVFRHLCMLQMAALEKAHTRHDFIVSRMRSDPDVAQLLQQRSMIAIKACSFRHTGATKRHGCADQVAQAATQADYWGPQDRSCEEAARFGQSRNPCVIGHPIDLHFMHSRTSERGLWRRLKAAPWPAFDYN